MMPKVALIPATLDDHPVIQHLGQLYVYDASCDCGFAICDNGLYEHKDYKNYFEDPSRKAFIVKVSNEIAGFVLLNKVSTLPATEWNLGEFFILTKFQNKGIGKEVMQHLWQMYPGKWEVSVIPENKSALIFWRKVIAHFTDCGYQETTRAVDYDKHQPKRIIFSFDTRKDCQ